MANVNFGYLDKAGEWHAVTTLEEDEYPRYYHQRQSEGGENDDSSGGAVPESEAPATASADATPKPEPLFQGHREFQENQRGVSYDTLLLPYLRGAAEITIVDAASSLAGATAGDLGDSDSVLRIQTTRLTYEIRRPVQK